MDFNQSGSRSANGLLGRRVVDDFDKKIAIVVQFISIIELYKII